MTDALIAALEKATGPDRRLDGLIYCHLHPEYKPYDPSRSIMDGMVWTGAISVSSVPAYTASIDAAMGLVPEGFYWSFDSRGCGIVCDYETPPLSIERAGSCLGHSVPAIALCIASLRARAKHRGSRHDVNVPFKSDVLATADAILSSDVTEGDQTRIADCKHSNEQSAQGLSQALEAFDKRMTEIGGCSDGYCQITGKAKGMHTNGGCRCAHQKYTAQRALGAAKTLRDAVAKELEK